MIDIKYSNFDLDTASHKSAISSAKQAVSKIIDSIGNKNPLYKIFACDHARYQAESCIPYVKEIKESFSDLIVVGMGGAVLNPQSLLSLIKDSEKSGIKIHYLHNTDPIFLEELLSKVSLKDCAVLAISNSGKTLETLSLVGVMISEFKKSGLSTELGKHFYFITNPESGFLKDIAQKISGTIIEHTAGISGRYSGLTNVTSLIAQVAGVDVYEYLDGAQLALDDLYQSREESKSALAASCIFDAKKPIMVNVGYLQRFDYYLEWYSQIIAESLGKDKKGITPIRGLGPNDQHSMFQLYLDGVQDKIYSLFYIKDWNNEYTSYKTCNMQELDYIANKKLQDINTANYEATLHSLVSKGLPTRNVLLENLSARSVGYLTAYSMLEVIILGHMIGVNPFDQPGVESIKKESKGKISL
ncbi:hypothetical protein OAP56_04200 [Rickettsiaceae bacterium]|nr:hypothetical protein [Rickettsiaceae bacterium]